MSAIAGILYFDGTPNAGERLGPMLDSMEHRGPRHVDMWTAANVALGCRLLHTTPESIDERLPLHNPTSNCAITADARIDNRSDLIAELGIDAKMPTDSEIILAAYERWGNRCPEKLLGDFAFAIWDEKKQSLFCARDRFGVRPFVYCRTNGFFAFASEVGGLLSLPDVPRHLDDTHVLEYLVAYMENTTSTLFRDIRKLPPAHGMTIDRNDAVLRRYWSLDASVDLRLKSDAEYAEAYRSLFSEAVKCRMRSSVTVGATLSGGLDSSSIACVARSFFADTSRGLPTFSVIFDDVPQSDERSFMQAVLATGGMEPHTIHGDRVGPMLDMECVVRHMGGPFHGPNLFLHWEMYRAAAKAGVGVILDGLDGDTTVSHGISRLTELARSGRWVSLVKEARAVGRRFDRPLSMVLGNYAVSPFVPDRGRVVWRTLRRRDRALRVPPVALSREFRRRSDFDSRVDELLTVKRRLPLTEKEAHLKSLSRGVLSRVLEITDAACAAFSIEGRYPFFDNRLIEFCLSLPAEQKLRNGWSRWILRQAMEGILPPEVQWRGGKSNLEHNFVHTLHTYDAGRLAEIIEAEQERLSEYVDIDTVRAKLARFVSDKSPRDGQSVMQVAILGLSLREYGI